MIQEYTCDDFVKIFGTDVTNTSFPANCVPTTTEPVASSTRGVFDLVPRNGGTSRNIFQIVPIGTGANDAIITGMRVFGWTRIKAVPPALDLWIPIPLFAADMVYGNVTGVAGSALPATYFFMDTITLTSGFGTASVDNIIISPGNDLVGCINFEVKGAQKIEVEVDLGLNSTAFNALGKRL